LIVNFLSNPWLG